MNYQDFLSNNSNINSNINDEIQKLKDELNGCRKENEELNNQIDIDISYIDVQMSQMTTESDITYTAMIIRNVKKEINKNINYQVKA